MTISFDVYKSIEVLEKDHWPPLAEYPSSLVERCYAYRKISVNELTNEQIRLLLGQEIGVEFLIPIAIQKLEQDILASGDFDNADILHAAIRITPAYWKQHAAQWQKLVDLIDANITTLRETVLNRELYRNIESFKTIIPPPVP